MSYAYTGRAIGSVTPPSWDGLSSLATPVGASSAGAYPLTPEMKKAGAPADLFTNAEFLAWPKSKRDQIYQTQQMLAEMGSWLGSEWLSPDYQRSQHVIHSGQAPGLPGWTEPAKVYAPPALPQVSAPTAAQKTAYEISEQIKREEAAKIVSSPQPGAMPPPVVPATVTPPAAQPPPAASSSPQPTAPSASGIQPGSPDTGSSQRTSTSPGSTVTRVVREYLPVTLPGAVSERLPAGVVETAETEIMGIPAWWFAVGIGAWLLLGKKR